MSVVTSVRINKQILEQAKELGLNISKICENALKIYITRLQDVNTEIGNLGSARVRSLVGRTSPSRNGRLAFSDVDWDGFERYLEGKYQNEKTRRERFNYARKFADVLLEDNYRRLFQFSEDKRSHILRALSALAKYLGVYEDFRKNVKAYGLTWSGRNGDDRIIARLTKVVDPNEVFEWIKQVKELNPDFEDFMDLMAFTGLRLVEAVRCYNLIIGLAREGRLSEYYNEKNSCLEHYKFKDLFIRSSKKAFISFVPKGLIDRIAENQRTLTVEQIQSRIKRQPMKSRFSDIREAHATFMTKYLRPSEIDFLHGRVSSSIFMRNYFNPALISDLKERVFKGINEIKALIS